MPNLDLSKIKKEHLGLACIILIVAIASFSYKGVFSPLLGKIKEVSAQTEQKKENIQKARISPEHLEDFEGEVEKLKARTDYYRQSAQTLADIPQILKELNQIAERLNIKFDSVSPLKREEIPLPGVKDYLLQVPIKIKLRCGYHQFAIFINQIESLQRFMEITRFKINADKGNIWTHRAELQITSYSLVSNK